LLKKSEAIFPMKRIIAMTVFASMAVMVTAGSGQSPASKDDETLLALAADVQAQQTRIADNQTKIDAKMAEVLEAVRVARIFAGRAGR